MGFDSSGNGGDSSGQDQSSQQSSDNSGSQDNSQQSSSDNSDTTQSQPMSPVGKAICSTAGGVIGQALDNAFIPDVGGMIGGAIGSSACSNK
jgi:hypothetical protein